MKKRAFLLMLSAVLLLTTACGGRELPPPESVPAPVETVELTERPFYVGVQYHPEFKSRPNHPHPLFRGFVGAAIRHAEKTTGI